MFIKVSTSGGHRYARLVASFRKEDGAPRPRTLAQLGRLTPGGDVGRLIRALLVAQGRDTSVLDERGTTTTSARAPDLQFQGARAVGDVWALRQVWQALDLDALRQAWGQSRSGLDVVALLRTMVFNRLGGSGSQSGRAALAADAGAAG